VLKKSTLVCPFPLNSDPDNLESVLKTGFTVSEEGKKFSSGTFRVKSWSDLEQGQSTTHRYLLCKMAVGRAVQSPYSTPPPAGQDGNGGQQRGHILPHGCHSIYVLSDAVDTLSPEQKEPGPEGDEDLMSKLLRTPYRHDYILFHTHQVLPCYVVEFEAKRDDEKKRGTAQAIIANAKEGKVLPPSINKVTIIFMSLFDIVFCSVPPQNCNRSKTS
jgi:hypothetical protein